MENKTEYDIIATKNREELVQEINKAILRGWIPMGGATFAYHPQSPLWIQTIVRQIS